MATKRKASASPLEGMRPTCGDCDHADPHDINEGRCMFNPPVVFDDGDGGCSTMWPIVELTERACGRFKAKH